MTDDNITDISQRGPTAMKDDMKAVFGIVEDCGNGEWLWVQPGKFRMAVGGPGSLTYSDRASAERDAEKIRAERPGSNLTVVVTTPAADEDEGRRFSSLAESNGIEGAIWESVNAFNRAQLSLGDPPATCDEIIEALAHAVHYVLVFLAEPDFGYAEPDEKDPPDVTRLEKVDYGDDIVLADRFAEELKKTYGMPQGGGNGT